MTNEIKRFVVTIDGPAGSGKSSTAKRVASELGFLYLDSGALYRAITLFAVREKIDCNDPVKVSELAKRAKVELLQKKSGLVVLLNGEDVSRDIRLPEITRQIKPIAANQDVRMVLESWMQETAKSHAVIAEGRDMGTVVFPDADLKIFMLATLEQRASRRQKELQEKGTRVDLEELKKEITLRDASDQSREFGPLKRAHDAIELDTSTMSLDEQVKFIIQKVKDENSH